MSWGRGCQSLEAIVTRLEAVQPWHQRDNVQDRLPSHERAIQLQLGETGKRIRYELQVGRRPEAVVANRTEMNRVQSESTRMHTSGKDAQVMVVQWQ